MAEHDVAVRLVGSSIASSVTAAILTSGTIGDTGVPTGHAYNVSFTIGALSVSLAAVLAALLGWVNRSRPEAAPEA